MNWSVLTDPDANLRDDARAELARLDRGARKALSQELGTIVNKKLEETIRPWFSRGAQDWAEVDVCAAELRDGVLVLHFIADHYNYNFAQSGSDWADHYVFVGETHLVEGKREHETFALEQEIHLSERESKGYVRRKILDTVRAQLRAKLYTSSKESGMAGIRRPFQASRFPRTAGDSSLETPGVGSSFDRDPARSLPGRRYPR